MSRFDARAERARVERRRYLHHLGWSIVCIILLVTLIGIWIHAQTQDRKVAALEKQLSIAQLSVSDTCKVTGAWQPNQTTIKSSGERRFLVHTPEDFKDGVYYPVVMAYPGKGGTAQSAEASFGLDSLPAIAVYPYPTIGNDGSFAWQGAPYSSGVDDVRFTTDILALLQNELCIDKTRIYAVGFSNGGGFTAFLGCSQDAARFAAFATIAGAMYWPEGDCQPVQPRPLLSVHGDNDSVVPYSGSLTRKLPHIDLWTQKRALANGCKKQSTAVSGFNHVTTWEECTDGATVQNIRIQGGDHGWGSTTYISLWDFLSQYSL